MRGAHIYKTPLKGATGYPRGGGYGIHGGGSPRHFFFGIFSRIFFGKVISRESM